MADYGSLPGDEPERATQKWWLILCGLLVAGGGYVFYHSWWAAPTNNDYPNYQYIGYLHSDETTKALLLNDEQVLVVEVGDKLDLAVVQTITAKKVVLAYREPEHLQELTQVG